MSVEYLDAVKHCVREQSQSIQLKALLVYKQLSEASLDSGIGTLQRVVLELRLLQANTEYDSSAILMPVLLSAKVAQFFNSATLMSQRKGGWVKCVCVCLMCASVFS